jgi:hypothetical protein
MNKFYSLLFITVISFIAGAPQAFSITNGYVDLSQHDFTAKDDVDLTGEWKFKWQEDDLQFSLINYDDTGWSTIKVPSFWNSVTGNGQGYGWLRLKIKRNPSVPLALYLPGCLTSYELYVNEKLVMQNGVFSKDKKNAVPQRVPLFIKLPDDENLVIAWRISNFSDYHGGPDNSPRIGLYDKMSYKLSLIKFIDTLIIGAIMSLFIYYLILWTSLKKVKVHLLFSLLCLFIALRILAANYYFESIFDFKSTVLFEIRAKIEYLIGFIGWALIPIIIHILYHYKINNFYTKFIRNGTIVYSIFVLFTSVSIYSRYMYFYQAFLILSGCWNLVTLTVATIKREKYATILLIGFSFF